MREDSNLKEVILLREKGKVKEKLHKEHEDKSYVTINSYKGYIENFVSKHPPFKTPFYFSRIKHDVYAGEIYNFI